MPNVKVKPNEPFDVALRRFKRACEKAGILAEVRDREGYEKPTTVRKRKKAAAVKRAQKKQFSSMPRAARGRSGASRSSSNSRTSSRTGSTRSTGGERSSSYAGARSSYAA